MNFFLIFLINQVKTHGKDSNSVNTGTIIKSQCIDHRGGNFMRATFKTGVILGGLAAIATIAYQQYQQRKTSTDDIDHRPSVDAKRDPAEVGLTQLDSIHRADWQANGFPQTHAELERLEQEED